jgi:tetratricopeptide (TPR) repeat protein
MKNPNSKTVSVVFDLQEVQNDSAFFPIPGETPSVHEVRDILLKRYNSKAGKTEIQIEGGQIRIVWRPEYIDVNAENLNAEAIRFAKSRNFDQAISKWKQASAINGNDVEYLYNLGLLYYEQKRYSESMQFLEKAIVLCPVHHKAHLALGINHVKMRNFDAAARHVSESIRLNKNNVLAYLNMGAIYSVKKRFNEAIEMFNKTIQLSPRESRAYLGMAKIYVQLSDTEAANSYFRKVIELSPNTSIAEFAEQSMVRTSSVQDSPISQDQRIENLTKGIGYSLGSNYPLAVDHYKAYLKIQSSDDYAWYLLGEAQLRLNRIEEAVDSFRRCIRLNAKRGLYFKTLGIALFLLKKNEEAAENFKKAVELGKTDPLVITLYGICLAREKRTDESTHQFKLTLKKHPNNPLALYHLALALIKQNENKKAADLLEKIKSMSVYAPVKEHAINLLNKM